MEALATEPSRLERREGEIAREVRNQAARTRLHAARPFQLPLRRTLISVLFIGGDEVAAGLGGFCRLVRPDRPEDLAAVIDGGPVDLLFIELSFDLGAQQAWRAVLGREHSPIRQPLLDRLAALDVVTLLWLTEPGDTRAAFSEPLLALGALFAADGGGGGALPHLPPAFDPHRFNPLKPTRAGRLADDLPLLLLDQLRALMYGANRDALAADIARFAAFPPAVAESRWRLRPDDDHVAPPLLDRYLGRIDAAERQAMLALARFALMPGASGGLSAARQRLEALGSGTLPILLGEERATAPFCLSAVEAAERILPRYPGLFWELERQAHRGYRDAHRHHSYQARLEQALAVLDDPRAADLKARLAPYAARCRVDLIVPTLRPWQLPFVHATFRAQTHGAKRLVLMIHGEPFDLPAHFPAIAADERVRWRFIPADYGIGTLLNIAAEESDADYWAKIDDDDFYGPDYIGDYVLLGSYADFGIAGKSNLFTYDEAEDAVFNRKDVGFTFTRKDTLAGGSFFCRRGAGLLPFDERVCGYADMDFLWRNDAAGHAIVASDRYNFCQIRRRDRTSHTWKIRSEDIVGREKVANGRRFAAVCA